MTIYGLDIFFLSVDASPRRLRVWRHFSGASALDVHRGDNSVGDCEKKVTKIASTVNRNPRKYSLVFIVLKT